MHRGERRAGEGGGNGEGKKAGEFHGKFRCGFRSMYRRIARPGTFSGCGNAKKTNSVSPCFRRSRNLRSGQETGRIPFPRCLRYGNGFQKKLHDLPDREESRGAKLVLCGK
jgi:hypothetical protein